MCVVCTVLLLQVSDWWEEYVYLRGRSPLVVNSNYYIMVQTCIRVILLCDELSGYNIFCSLFG